MKEKIAYRMNLIILATIGIIDLKTYRIPNAILIGWVFIIVYDCLISSIPLSIPRLISALITAGIYIPLRQVVRCGGGDFKLFAVIVLAIGLHEALIVCLLSMFLSLIPLASGVKKVPIAFSTFLAYTAFLLFK